MSVPILTFFSNKGGVGKTSLIYHLAWMFAGLGKRVFIADLDPQASLTAAFLDEDRIEELWSAPQPGSTIYECVKPLAGAADIAPPEPRKIDADLYLLPGDMALSGYEDILSEEWANSLADGNLYRPMRILASFWQVMRMAAEQIEADIILADIGPNLGAINRSALLAADYVAIPLGADLFSLQGLSHLGPTLSRWRTAWRKRVENWAKSDEKGEFSDFRLPAGNMRPIGYLCQQHSVRLARPVKAYDKWVQRIPAEYRQAVLGEPCIQVKQEEDPYCLAIIKHYRSLVPMGREHRKPIFNLTPADGAIGSHAHAVRDAKKDFKRLAEKIAQLIDLKI